MTKVTMTLAPWDRPPQDQTIARVANRAMAGELSARDIKYMACAILNMSDEVAELRRRVQLLEKRQGTGGGYR